LRLLDLFCGAGGAAVGYSRAGFDEIVGVDIKPQPRYPFEFVQADALAYPLDGFDAIHASPPCQRFTAMRTMYNAKEHADLLTPTRERLRGQSAPYVIENVPGSPTAGLTLCGSMFGLGIRGAQLRRHRLFEVWPQLIMTPACNHHSPVIGVYGQHGRDRRRSVETFYSVEDGRGAMGIDWMTGDELSQAIPPAYTEYVGRALIAAL
jgi:DNA (cytosine-5)-methyltransferase 1